MNMYRRTLKLADRLLCKARPFPPWGKINDSWTAGARPRETIMCRISGPGLAACAHDTGLDWRFEAAER